MPVPYGRYACGTSGRWSATWARLRSMRATIREPSIANTISTTPMPTNSSETPVDRIPMIARNANSSTQNPAMMAPVASQVAGWSGARMKRVTMPRSRSASSGPKAPRTRSSPRSRSGTPITRGRSRAAGAASRSRRRRT